MSALVPVPSIAAVHYFAGPHGYVFSVIYKPDETGTAGHWACTVQSGALAIDVDERAPAIGDAGEFAREHWPKVGGLMMIDHRGHRA